MALAAGLGRIGEGQQKLGRVGIGCQDAPAKLIGFRGAAVTKQQPHGFQYSGFQYSGLQYPGLQYPGVQKQAIAGPRIFGPGSFGPGRCSLRKFGPGGFDAGNFGGRRSGVCAHTTGKKPGTAHQNRQARPAALALPDNSHMAARHRSTLHPADLMQKDDAMDSFPAKGRASVFSDFYPDGLCAVSSCQTAGPASRPRTPMVH